MNVIKEIIKESRRLVEESEAKVKQSVKLYVSDSTLKQKIAALYSGVEDVDFEDMVSLEIEATIKFRPNNLEGFEVIVPPQTVQIGYTVSFQDGRTEDIKDFYEYEIKMCDVNFGVRNDMRKGIALITPDEFNIDVGGKCSLGMIISA